LQTVLIQHLNHLGSQFTATINNSLGSWHMIHCANTGRQLSTDAGARPNWRQREIAVSSVLTDVSQIRQASTHWSYGWTISDIEQTHNSSKSCFQQFHKSDNSISTISQKTENWTLVDKMLNYEQYSV